jgi:hypothetical protein
MRMRISHISITFGLLLFGCTTGNRVPSHPAVFQDLPASPTTPAHQVHSTPEPAPDTVRQKAMAAYAKTYWAQIYPDMRDCWYLPDIGQYAAAFRKSGQSLERFPKKDTRWHGVIATFDAQVRLVSCSPYIY